MTALRTITRGSIEWPTQLDDLGTGTPERLWLNGSGDLRLLALRSVAVVGARAATPYGMTVASTLARELTQAGWVVVSGGAVGIDSAAHRGALGCGGCTVGVLAGGVEQATSRAQAPLQARMAESGLLVSEMPPGSTPRRHSFLQRNRLIAALTRAVVVVEAGRRSGALNTARTAEGLRRHVLAVPGPVTSAVTEGTHGLIRDGRAVLVRDVSDALELLEPLGGAGAGTPGELDPLIAAALGPEPLGVDEIAETVGCAAPEARAALDRLRESAGVHPTAEGWVALEHAPAALPNRPSTRQYESHDRGGGRLGQ